MATTYTTPAGYAHKAYVDMLSEEHLLIAGSKGSGKSTVMNALMYTALYKAPTSEKGGAQFVILDPKGIDFLIYADLPHTLAYASEPSEMRRALEGAVNIMWRRYAEVADRSRKEGKRYSKYWGGDLYVIVDEYADLVNTDRKKFEPLIQTLSQTGRAANIHVILATQCPKADIVDTKIKCNFDSRVGLRTAGVQDSRNILDEIDDCAYLPRYGFGMYKNADGVRRVELPMYSDAELEERVAWWTRQKPAAPVKSERKSRKGFGLMRKVAALLSFLFA